VVGGVAPAGGRCGLHAAEGSAPAGPGQGAALEALTWVGAVHRRDPEPPPPNFCLEDADSVQRVAEVRQSPEVRKAIRLLAHSDHAWIKEAARAALQELGERQPDGP
jgi:hypothetical protein